MHSKVADLLLQIEQALRELELWSDKTPTSEQLMSSEPFCLDTLTFPEWIQFVFIEKLNDIIEQGTELPMNSSIAPMAEEFFRGADLNVKNLVELMGAFDQLVSNR